MVTIATTTLLLALNIVRKPEIPLKFDLLLNQVAEVRCKEMTVWSHNGWLKYTPKIFKKYNYAGEVLALDYYTSTTTVNAWLNSPSHKEILLAKRYTNVGFATCKNSLGIVTVGMFAGN